MLFKIGIWIMKIGGRLANVESVSIIYDRKRWVTEDGWNVASERHGSFFC